MEDACVQQFLCKIDKMSMFTLEGIKYHRERLEFECIEGGGGSKFEI